MECPTKGLSRQFGVHKYINLPSTSLGGLAREAEGFFE